MCVRVDERTGERNRTKINLLFVFAHMVSMVLSSRKLLQFINYKLGNEFSVVVTKTTPATGIGIQDGSVQVGNIQIPTTDSNKYNLHVSSNRVAQPILLTRAFIRFYWRIKMLMAASFPVRHSFMWAIIVQFCRLHSHSQCRIMHGTRTHTHKCSHGAWK